MQSAIERRQRIVEILNMRRCERLENLAHELNVSKMTIRRDIEVLTCSYPIDTKQGNGGCVFVQEGFDLYERYLSAKQFELLERLKEGIVGEDKKIMETILRSFGRNGGVRNENDKESQRRT